MASPQIENGHTNISNEFLDFLCSFRIPGECRQVFDAIMRKTWGWHKKEDYISESQLVDLTKLKRQNVWRSVSKLIANRLVIKTDCKLKINKNYIEWKPFVQSKRIAGKMQSKLITPAIKTDYKMQSKLMDTKEKKETIQKKESLFASNEAVILSFFGNLEVSDKKIIELATKYDVRPKDVVFVLRELITYKSEKGEMIDDVLLQANKSLNLALRWHKIKTLSDKEEVETAKSKTKTNAEDEWIKTIKFVGG